MRHSKLAGGKDGGAVKHPNIHLLSFSGLNEDYWRLTSFIKLYATIKKITVGKDQQ